MANWNFSRYFWSGLGGVALVSPLAVVIACGETSTTPTPPAVKTTLTVSDLSCEPNSTSAKVTWTGAVSVTGDEVASYAPVEYLSGAYATQEAAATATTWSASLPTSVPFVMSARNLWARALPRAGATLTPLYLDLTALSKVQDVPSDVDAEPATAELKTALDAAKITGASLNELELNLPPVPAELPLAFEVQINDGVWSPIDSFNAAMTTFSNTFQLGDPLTIKVRLQLTGDSTTFIFTPPLARELDVTEVKFYLQSGASLYDGDFSAAASVSHDQLTYVGEVKVIGADKGNYGPVEYLTGNFPTRASAEAAAGWSTALPTTTSFQPRERFFWARALPLAIAPATSKALYANITGDPASANNRRSGIRQVKGNVNAAPTYAAIDLTRLTFAGTAVSAITLTGTPDLAALPLALELQINESAWFTAAAFSVQLEAFSLTYQVDAPLIIRARLTLVDPQGTYLFTPPAPVVLDATSVQKVLANVAVLNTSGFRVDVARSTHDNLVWLGNVFIQGAGVFKFALEYLASEVATTSAANAAQGWQTSVPNVTSFDPARRHLYVRLRPFDANAGLTTIIEDVTSTSQLLAVKANVNALPEYTSVNLSTISLVSYQPPATAPAAARQLLIENTPQFITAPLDIQISFDEGASWTDASDQGALTEALAQFVLARADLTQTPQFWARVSLKPNVTWAVFTAPPATTLRISAAFAADLYAAAPIIEVDLTSIINAQWSPFVVNDGAWAVRGAVEKGRITQAEYDAHKAQWDDTNARTKLAALTGKLKEAVVGFETIGIFGGSPITPEEVVALESSPAYQDDNRFHWRWGDEREKWQWNYTGSAIPENIISMWARVKLATTKKFVAKQVNAWNIMRPSRLFFANVSFLFDYTPITADEFAEVNAFLQQNIKRDADNSTASKLAFLPISAPIPAPLREGRMNVVFLVKDQNGDIIIFEEVTNWAQLPVLFVDAGKALGEVQVVFFGTKYYLSREEPGPKTYIPGSLLDVAKDINIFPKGVGHVVTGLDSLV